jgi:hypothetical protein
MMYDVRGNRLAFGGEERILLTIGGLALAILFNLFNLRLP